MTSRHDLKSITVVMSYCITKFHLPTVNVIWVSEVELTLHFTLPMVTITRLLLALNPVPVMFTNVPDVTCDGEILWMVGVLSLE